MSSNYHIPSVSTVINITRSFRCYEIIISLYKSVSLSLFPSLTTGARGRGQLLRHHGLLFIVCGAHTTDTLSKVSALAQLLYKLTFESVCQWYKVTI
jgi:hypothetical protein